MQDRGDAEEREAEVEVPGVDLGGGGVAAVLGQVALGRGDAEAGEVVFQDFVEAIENISPSVSPEEMRSYELLRQTLRK